MYAYIYKRWVIEVNGAPGTLYANETYQLQVDFPEHYPMEAPQVYVKLLDSVLQLSLLWFDYWYMFFDTHGAE